MNDAFNVQGFSEDGIPKYPCPSCSIGWLVKSKFEYANNAETAKNHNEPWFDVENYGFVFSCLLECNNCKEAVSSSGISGVERHYDEENPGQTVHYEYFVPTFFQPALPIIKFPSGTTFPKKIGDILEKSFSLFWSDYDACANRIRATLEILLDDMQVKRRVNPDAGKELNLHQRIETLTPVDGTKEADVKEMLMALKWLGNAGSHELEGISRSQLIQGYKMMENVLKLQYPAIDHEMPMLVAKAKEVNLVKKWHPGL